MKASWAQALAGLCLLLATLPGGAVAQDADALVRAAFNNWRAQSSYSEITMTVHRPDWERRSSMEAWTRGDDDALVRFTAPAQDAGNATLTVSNQTWIYNPRLNQVIRLPASMMAQSWMGSDFSYNDLSKSDDLLGNYDHRVIAVEQERGHGVYTIEASPKPGAPVVWGKIVVRVRDDGVLLAETFYDQNMAPVRAMTTERVTHMGGRDYPAVITMRPNGENDHWTRIETTSARFNSAIPNYVFSRSNLQNPRR